MKPIPPISPEYRQFVTEHAPAFARAVADAKRRGEGAATGLRPFRDNPFLLYAALWLADSEGVTVTLTPTPRRASRPA